MFDLTNRHTKTLQPALLLPSVIVLYPIKTLGGFPAARVRAEKQPSRKKPRLQVVGGYDHLVLHCSYKYTESFTLFFFISDSFL